MDEKIEVCFGSTEEGAKEILNKLKAEQKILELFETEKIEKITIQYKKREQACCRPHQN